MWKTEIHWFRTFFALFVQYVSVWTFSDTYLNNMIKWFLLHFFVALLKLVFLSSRLQSLVWLLAQFFAVVWVNRMRSVRIYAVADSISSWGWWSRRTLGRIRARRLVVFTQIDDCASKLVLSYICCVQHWSRRLFWYRGTKICWHNKWDAKLLAHYLQKEGHATCELKYKRVRYSYFWKKNVKYFSQGRREKVEQFFWARIPFQGRARIAPNKYVYVFLREKILTSLYVVQKLFW